MDGLDSVQSVRDAMIEKRDRALRETNFADAVLFSHVIAHLFTLLPQQAPSVERGENISL